MSIRYGYNIGSSSAAALRDRCGLSKSAPVIMCLASFPASVVRCVLSCAHRVRDPRELRPLPSLWLPVPAAIRAGSSEPIRAQNAAGILSEYRSSSAPDPLRMLPPDQRAGEAVNRRRFRSAAAGFCPDQRSSSAVSCRPRSVRGSASVPACSASGIFARISGAALHPERSEMLTEHRCACLRDRCGRSG